MKTVLKTFAAALLLATGEIGRIDVALLGQANPGQQLFGFHDRHVALDAEHMHGNLDDVLDQRHVAPQVEALKNHAEA